MSKHDMQVIVNKQNINRVQQGKAPVFVQEQWHPSEHAQQVLLQSTAILKQRELEKRQAIATAGQQHSAPEAPNRFLNKYNDPFQINSILDVFLNDAALKQAYANYDPKQTHKYIIKSMMLSWLPGANLIWNPVPKQALVAYKDYIKNSFVEPLKRGQWQVSAMNMLQAVGEDLDLQDNIPKSVLAPLFNQTTDRLDYEDAVEAVNRVKLNEYKTYYDKDKVKHYVIPTSKETYNWTEKQYKVAEEVVNSGRTVNPYNLTWDERLKSAIGIGEHGRINYEFHTGAFWSDMIGEVAAGSLDSIITHGAKIALKASTASAFDAASAALKESGQELAGEAADQISKRTRKEVIRDVNNILRTGSFVADNGPDKQLLSLITGVAVKGEGVQQEFAIKTMSEAMTLMFIKHGIVSDTVSNPVALKKVIDRVVNRSVGKMATTVIRAVDNISDAANQMSKAALYMDCPPVAMYAAAKHATGFPGLGKWIASKLRQAGKANSIDGFINIEELYDNTHAMKQAQQVVGDAIDEVVEDPSKIARVYGSIIRDNKFFSYIINNITDSNVEVNLKSIKDYLKRNHSKVDLDTLIKNAEIFYTQNPDYVTWYYKNLLTNVQNYIQEAEKYIGVKQLQDKHLNVLHTLDTIINNENVTAALKNNLLNSTADLVQVPMPFRGWYKAKLIEDNISVLGLYKAVDSVRALDQNRANTLYKDIQNILYHYTDDLAFDVDTKKVIKTSDEIFNKLQNLIEETTQRLDSIETPKMPKKPELPIIESVINGNLTAYDSATKLLTVFQKADVVVDLSKLSTEQQRQMSLDLAVGKFDLAYLKMENSAVTDFLLECSATKTLEDMLSVSGELGVQINKLLEVPDLPQDVRAAAQTLQSAFKEQQSYRQLLNDLQHIEDITPEQLEALKQAMQNFTKYPKNSAYLSIKRFSKRIIDSANSFIGARKQMKHYTVNAYLQEHLDEVNSFRKTLGLDPIFAEEHSALSDTITQYIMWKDLVKSNPKYANKKFAIMDLESTNVGVNARANAICQAGIFSDTISKEYTLSDAVFDPYKNAPAEAFMRAQLNDQVSSYDDLLDKWINTRFVNGKETSEEEIITKLLNDISDQAQGTWNGKAYDFVLAAHNGNLFDFDLLKNKVANLREKGLLTSVKDPYILDHISYADTLELWHKADGWDIIEPGNAPKIEAALFSYIRSMQKSKEPLFSAITDNKLYQLDAAILTLKNADNIVDANLCQQALSAVKEVLGTLKAVSELQGTLSNSAINLTKLSKSNESIVQIIEMLKANGLTDGEAIKLAKFANKDNDFNLSTLIYNVSGDNAVGWKHFVQSKDLNKIFDTTVLKPEDLQDLQEAYEFAHSVSKKANNIPLEYLDEETTDTMRNILSFIQQVYVANVNVSSESESALALNIIDILSDVPNVANLKFDINDSQVLASLFKQVMVPLAEKYPVSFYELLTKGRKFGTGTSSTAISKLRALVNSYNEGGKDILERWSSEIFGGNYSTVEAYDGIYYDLLNNTKGIIEASKAFADANIADAVEQTRLAAMIPSKNLAAKFKKLCRTLISQDALSPEMKYAEKFEDAMYDLRQQTVRNVLNYAFAKNTDLVQWLGSSGGLIIFEDPTIFKNLDLNALAAQNIKAVDLGNNQFVVYLTKASGYVQRFETLENDVTKVINTINGVEYEQFQWDYDTFENLDTIIKNKIGLEEHISESAKEASKTLAYLTNGAASATTFENMNLNTLDKIRKLLPNKVLNDMPDLPNSIVFQNNGYNHTVLGSADLIKAWTGQITDDPIKMMCKASMESTQMHNTINTFTTTILSDYNKIQGTPLGDILLKDPNSAVTWFSKHPEYTLVNLQPANNQLGYKLVSYDSKNIVQAINDGARIIPTNAYDRMYSLLNNSVQDKSVLKALNSIMRLFKIGYLVKPSTAANNTLDSMLKITVANKTNIGDTASEYFKAVQIYHNYDSITNELIRMTPEAVNFDTFLKSDAVKNYFSSNKFALDYDTYMFYNKLFQEASVSGEIKALSKYTNKQRLDYLKRLELEGAIDSTVFMSAKAASAKELIFSKALNMMNYTESIARIAQFNLTVKQGKTYIDALQTVSKTQFNYENKTEFERNVETILPFYTFMNRNLSFWLDMLEENPGFFSTLEDFLSPLWNLDQYDEEELEYNSSLQNAILSGNIKSPFSEDTYIKTNFSFMDTINLLLNPLKAIKESVFSPVQSIIDVGLQRLSDESYHNGEEAVSNWIQNYFGAMPTEQQLLDKYGDWAEEYKDKFNKKTSSENAVQLLMEDLHSWEMVPLIGTIIQRFVNTNMYYADDKLKAAGYLFGFTGGVFRFEDEEEEINFRQAKYYRLSDMLSSDYSDARTIWADICNKYDLDPNQNIYSIKMPIFTKMYEEFSSHYKAKEIHNFLELNDAMPYLYAKLRDALGYKDVNMRYLPSDVQTLIYELLTNQPITERVMPLLQDNKTVLRLWKDAELRYNLVGVPFEKIPTPLLNQIYRDIAKSCVLMTEIQGMLNTTDYMRLTYSMARRKLGLDGIPLNTLPLDALNVIKYAMENDAYKDEINMISQITTRLEHNEDARYSYGIVRNQLGYAKGTKLVDISKDDLGKLLNAVVNPQYKPGTHSSNYNPTIGEILQQLNGDSEEAAAARYSFAVVRNQLGYEKGTKLTEMTPEDLEVLKQAVIDKQYRPHSRSGGYRRGASYLARRPKYPKYKFTSSTYDKSKAKWPNYNHSLINKQRHRIYERQYINNVRATGVTNKIQNYVHNKMTPIELKYRIKDMYYYFK